MLIHKHLAGLSPRLIPGSSPRSTLHCFQTAALCFVTRSSFKILSLIRVRQTRSTSHPLAERNAVHGGDSELNLASPLCHEGQHGGSIGSEGCESQVGMKRGKERCDRSLTVSYGIGCQLNQLIRNNLPFGASLSFEGRETPSFSLPGSAEGARVLIHSCLMASFRLPLQAQISRSFGLKLR